MRAAIFIQRGVPEDKQTAICLSYIDEQHWQLGHVVPYWSPEAAASLVRDGAVQVIVAGFTSKALVSLAADIGDGGQVVFVHPTPTVIQPPRRKLSIGPIAELARRLKDRGDSTREVARLFEVDTGEIRRIIR